MFYAFSCLMSLLFFVFRFYQLKYMCLRCLWLFYICSVYQRNKYNFHALEGSERCTSNKFTGRIDDTAFKLNYIYWISKVPSVLKWKFIFSLVLLGLQNRGNHRCKKQTWVSHHEIISKMVLRNILIIMDRISTFRNGEIKNFHFPSLSINALPFDLKTNAQPAAKAISPQKNFFRCCHKQKLQTSKYSNNLLMRVWY